MGATLVIGLFFATHLHAASIDSIATSASTSTTVNGISADSTTSPAPFDIEAELAKIAAPCLSTSNYEELSGNVVRGMVARILSNSLMRESVVTIGLAELRKALNFAKLRPWQHYNRTKPSEDELASAQPLEAYYDLKEPRSKMRSLDSDYLFEHNVATAISYLDARFPSIRAIFRRRFEEIRQSGVLDRKAIDNMIDEFLAIYRRVNDATSRSSQRQNECWDD